MTIIDKLERAHEHHIHSKREVPGMIVISEESAIELLTYLRDLYPVNELDIRSVSKHRGVLVRYIKDTNFEFVHLISKGDPSLNNRCFKDLYELTYGEQLAEPKELIAQHYIPHGLDSHEYRERAIRDTVKSIISKIPTRLLEKKFNIEIQTGPMETTISGSLKLKEL